MRTLALVWAWIVIRGTVPRPAILASAVVLGDLGLSRAAIILSKGMGFTKGGEISGRHPRHRFEHPLYLSKRRF